ncbi:chalcone isomerase family protein [Flavobacterium sp. NRK F10]|uniref:Chalcone isomerase n=1 Tax=Flavobacterium sediminis TaxID=2201181 RepID=A0A2U8QWT6_9FLAO|nr:MULTISPECIES: chalcone isomerase family protein [Flavobacterium]AWM14519.1 chalcone isomerase [Flavobacterium sediminis]MCO6175752.1 chalcone isomerase family protein [Flavobacterium sp. NRK F10]
MKKQIALMLLVISSSLMSFAQTTISGVKVDGKLSIDGQDLILNGAGLREKLWIDLYVGALYLPKKSNSANDIMASADGAAIKLTIVSGMITSEKMINAVNEGFENATKGNTASIKTKIEKFKSFFSEEIKKGDQFLIVNVPGTGIVVYKNGVKKGSIDGHDFKKALFGIWLCDKPADKNLKAGMLGK